MVLRRAGGLVPRFDGLLPCVFFCRALRRAKAAGSGWDEEERIFKATITWVDSRWEYETEVENEGMTDSEFTAWIKEHAEGIAKDAAKKENTTFEEVDRIAYEFTDNNARFEEAYEAACESEWECRAGR